jgi:NADH-quinone oxidoreductase subunit C
MTDALVATFPEGALTREGSTTVRADRRWLREVATFVRADPAHAFDLPIDCTAVDYIGRELRFEVVYQLYSTEHRRRLTIKVSVPEEDATCPSLTPVWPGLNWHERETWDMYGVRFIGHPNLRRVLMYESFEGFPLRKDYPIDKRQPLIEMRPVDEIPTQRQPPPEKLNRP